MADGLSEKEFFCEGGDPTSTSWVIRRDKVVHVIKSMFASCDVVVTQENDHFFDILNGINDLDRACGGIFAVNVAKPSKASQLKARSQLRQWNQMEASAITQEESSYQHCNAVFHSHSMLPGDPQSFQQECSQYGTLFSSLYGCQADDLHQSHDGIGVYYRKDKLHLEDVSLVGGVPCQTVSAGDAVIVTNAESFVRCTFQLPSRDNITEGSASKRLVTIYGGHLKSGEDVKMEHARCRELFHVLHDAEQCTHPAIIAMDSNNSLLYEQSYPDDTLLTITSNIHPGEVTTTPGKLSAVIEQFNYVDAVGPAFQIGNECFKMRHGLGGQPAKQFQLMFDTIDKILVPRCLQVAPHVYNRNEFGFQRYDLQHRQEILALRCDADKRAALEQECRNNSNICSTACSVEAFGADNVLSGLYPNTAAPSDHPPVSCTILLPPL